MTLKKKLETMLKEENVTYEKHARELLANQKQPTGSSTNEFSIVRIGKCKIMWHFLFEKKNPLSWDT